MAALGRAHHRPQGGLYPFPGAIPRPTAEVFVQGLPRGQIVRHQAPGTAAPQHIQDALHHLPQVHGAGAAARFGRRPQGCPPCPLGIAEVAGVSFSSHVYAGVWGWGLTYTIVQNQHFGNTLLGRMLQLLADWLVNLQVVDSISRKTVHPFRVRLLSSWQNSHMISCLTLMPKQ